MILNKFLLTAFILWLGNVYGQTTVSEILSCQESDINISWTREENNETTSIYNTDSIYHLEKELRTQKKWVILTLGILFVSLILSCILFYFYLNLRIKNRDLYLRFNSVNTIETLPSSQQNNSETHLLPPGGEIRHQELFERLRTYLLTDRNFTKTDIDTNILITELSTNRSYLFEAVKMATGKTLQEYINTLRMEEAKSLLETTDEVVDNISIICGYSSVRTFYRLFRSHYNMTPAMYRKIAKERKEQV